LPSDLFRVFHGAGDALREGPWAADPEPDCRKCLYGLRQNGADGVSVVDLMRLAGLTHGGFYSHFDSREALVIEVFAQAMDRTVADWLKIMKGMPVEERFDAVVDACLSPCHRDNAAGDETLSDDILEAGRQALRSRSAARRSSR
jgi:TetR/AcrR family transcriptional regulator, transcriptional repressor for nem operon